MIRKSDYENYDYRQFWQGHGRNYEDGAERSAIKKLFKGIKTSGKVFADLGCGYARLFNEYKDFDTIILVDYSLNNIKNARLQVLEYLKDNIKKSPDIYYIVADVTCLPLKKNIADTCFSVRVIHHLEKPDAFFSEVHRIIKPGGEFILEFANKRNIKNILKFLLRKTAQSPFSKRPLQVGETILNYHPKFIAELIKESGFVIKRKISASNFRLGFLKRLLNLKLLLFFENFYQNAFSFIDTGPSIFLKAVSQNIPCPESSDKNINSLRFFACPSCRCNELIKEEDTGDIVCKGCGRHYSVIEGIYVFKSE
ncbi:MAG: methyltransferase domain-containing protein [Actinobacteria bacterium]|nr:methyltransferase domain-containing protein [Actinomycetota bacterium]